MNETLEEAIRRRKHDERIDNLFVLTAFATVILVVLAIIVLFVSLYVL